ncbi:MAG TPA: hypothetical protein VL992_14720, partial [Tepidisphaeraceae bacterium]|nr:hypothetical protein [Tepidisphaeraceae bacterium]
DLCVLRGEHEFFRTGRPAVSGGTKKCAPPSTAQEYSNGFGLKNGGREGRESGFWRSGTRLGQTSSTKDTKKHEEKGRSKLNGILFASYLILCT